MSLKARIRHHAKRNNLPAQVVLQNYMFERFLARLSTSTYRDEVILKGGLLIAALLGIDRRSTMDMDVTIRGYPLRIGTIEQMINDICFKESDDTIGYTLLKVAPIRDDDRYGGYRASLLASFDGILTPLKIDITTGDVITPVELRFSYKTLFGNATIDIWTYPIETVLAEKIETIMRRSVFNTRPRDFYDVHLLTMTQSFDESVFKEALARTANHRKSMHIFIETDKRLRQLRESTQLKERWTQYTKEYDYAKGIPYDAVIRTVESMINL